MTDDTQSKDTVVAVQATATDDVRAMVSSWLGTHSESSDDESDVRTRGSSRQNEDEEEQMFRPRRVGLGAQFLSHRQAMESHLGEKIKRKIGTKKAEKEKEEDEESSEEEAETKKGLKAGKQQPMKGQKRMSARDSLIESLKSDLEKKVATKEKLKSRKKKKKEREAKPAEPEAKVEPALPDSTTTKSPDASHESVDTPPTESSSFPPETPEEIAEIEDGQGNRWQNGKFNKRQWNDNGDGEQIPRKKKRTRSRQKNIRKDNRPDHLKPTYLDPNAKDYRPPSQRFGERKRFSAASKEKSGEEK